MPKVKDRHYRGHREESHSDSSGSVSPRERSPAASSHRSNRRERDRSRERKRRRHRSRSRERYRRRSTSRDRMRKSRRRSKSRERGRRSRSRSRSRSRRKDKKQQETDVATKTSSTTEGSKASEPKPSETAPPPTKPDDVKLEKPPTLNDQPQKVAVEIKKEIKKETDSKKESSSSDALEQAMAAQKKLEEEMRKRRERLEAWRQKRQKEEEEEAKMKTEEDEEDEGAGHKGWTLEDDEEDDEVDTTEMEVNEDPPEDKKVNNETPMEEPKKEEEEEDVDPLDAFMEAVQEEVKQINKVTQSKSGTKQTTTTAKKGSTTLITVTKIKDEKEKRGELLHNDQDAMEYSEEEGGGDEELASALMSIARKNKKKELPVVDHRVIDYQDFRKDFYVEVPELAKMTNEEVQAYRRELESIKVKGKDCPKPVKTWAQCGLSTKILDVIKKNNYETPTPIQAQAIPAVMSGRDLIGIAKTGSGKTLAFLLPMFRHILDQPPLEYKDGPIGVILTPTRELAIQIFHECKKFCKSLKLRPVCVYGGTGISEQIADLKRGTEIVICTPGRMIDMLAANSGRVTNFRRTTYVVLDEADRMFDMGFEPQVMKIISNVRPDRQTVMFSATFPRQMEALARKILSKPIEVQVGGRSVVCKDVEQSVIVIDEHQKYFKLLELLGIFYEKGSVLVFVEKQQSADQLLRDLMKSSYPCLALHGGMDQFDRDSTIADFKNGVVKLMIATSVAARGLDVKQLILVINYDCPNHYEDYVHRCGRTGRAGNKGNAYTFITPDQQKYSGDIIKALELSGASVPSDLEEMWKTYTDKLIAEGKMKEKQRRKPRRMLAIGFRGKGYKFDEKEAARDTEAKLKQKSALGMADSDDEDEFALLTIDKKLEEIFGGRVQVKDPNAPILPPSVSGASKPGLLPTPPPSERLDLAMEIASKIISSKNLTAGSSSSSIVGGGASLAAQEAASSIMKGGEVHVSGAALASQIAASINKKVGAAPAKVTDTYLPIGAIIPGQEPVSGEPTDTDQPFLKYCDEVEINSFPQRIRFRITTREVLDDIGEYSEAYITVRGIYIPESRQPIEGERRLFLSIEGKSERAVKLAKQEIKRVIKEEAQRMASRVRPTQKSGRYSVL